MIRKRKSIVFYLVSLLLVACEASRIFAQPGVINDQRKALFRDESSFGVFLHTNGFGLNYRYGFFRNARNQFIIDADLSYIKHPKEVKTQVLYEYSTRRYVYGKENLFWELKGTTGWQKELYRKHDKGGISVRLFYEGGFSLGFLKPIYYEVLISSSSGDSYTTDFRKFDLAFHQSDIGGRGPFFKGFDEIQVVPGLTAKTGMSFEYSQRDAVIHALEAGIALTVYPKKIPIMATEYNNFLFFSLSVGYRFGNIIDISEAARAKTRKERRKARKESIESQYPPAY